MPSAKRPPVLLLFAKAEMHCLILSFSVLIWLLVSIRTSFRSKYCPLKIGRLEENQDTLKDDQKHLLGLAFISFSLVCFQNCGKTIIVCS